MSAIWARMLTVLSMGLLVFVCGGATCARRDVDLYLPPPPRVLSEAPSTQEVLEAVNRTSAVSALSTNTASVEVLSMPNLPRLSATINLQRDRNFRLKASLPVVMGSGIDLGSNADVFWLEIPERVRKTLYYARHDRYRQQLNRAILPVDPTWVMDALGLAQIDPASVAAGPVRRPDGKLEIRSVVAMGRGDAASSYQQVYYIDPSGGFVTDLLLYDPSNRLVARSAASQHVFYDSVACSLPHRVDVHLDPLAPTQISLRVEAGSYLVNQLLSPGPTLFVMPSPTGTAIDLTSLGPGMPAPRPSAYAADASLSVPIRGLR